jgi:hypothetical protein
MGENEIKVKRDSQNRESEAWKKLLTIIDEAASDNRLEFYPSKELGIDIWKDIRSLPKEISTLKNIKHLMLYGSNLEWLPQEIGDLESLEIFTPYTSYGLRWFPYELIECENLKESTVSTRALFGNKKNRKPFPNLSKNPVEYFGGNKCSICKRNEAEMKFEQYWISTQIGTDILPLLAIVCSADCYSKLVKPHVDYYPDSHKGGNLNKYKT